MSNYTFKTLDGDRLQFDGDKFPGLVDRLRGLEMPPQSTRREYMHRVALLCRELFLSEVRTNSERNFCRDLLALGIVRRV